MYLQARQQTIHVSTRKNMNDLLIDEAIDHTQKFSEHFITTYHTNEMWMLSAS